MQPPPPIFFLDELKGDYRVLLFDCHLFLLACVHEWSDILVRDDPSH